MAYKIMAYKIIAYKSYKIIAYKICDKNILYIPNLNSKTYLLIVFFHKHYFRVIW